MYDYLSSVSAMLKDLKTVITNGLEETIQIKYVLSNCLWMNIIGLTLPSYYLPTSNHTRQHHPLHLCLVQFFNT